MPGALEMTASTSKSRAKLEEQPPNILHDRHGNADQLRVRVTWLPWQKQLGSAHLESAIKPLQDWEADESKSRLEEGSEASID